MAVKKEDTNFGFIAEPSKATVRMFALKKHEITMMALNEVDKLKNQLMFVSVSDYNKVVEENKQLRAMVTRYQMERSGEYVTKSMAISLTGFSGKRLNELAIDGLVKREKKGNVYTYNKEDLLRLVG